MDNERLIETTESSGIETIADTRIIMYQDAWKGDYSLDAIAESIEDQFNTYNNLDDTYNYVKQFYEQLDLSRDVAKYDETVIEDEYSSTLDKIEDDFIDLLIELFTLRLNIDIVQYDKDNINYDDMRFYIGNIYEYFILGAKYNFIEAITKDYLNRNKELNLDDDNLLSKVYTDLEIYSPLLVDAITCDEFLTYTNAKVIYPIWDGTEITGNFLQKYSPRLYRNDTLRTNIASNIIQNYMLKKGIESHGGE